MKSKQTWLIILLLLIVFIPRAATIHYGTNVDEGVYWVEAKHLYDGYWMYRDVQLNKPPLAALVALPFFLLNDTPIYPMRVTMLLFSLFGLYCVYRLAKQMFGEWAGIAALTFMALEPFSCVWAKYLHTSSWTPWFEAWILWLLISALQHENKRQLFFSGVILGFFALSKQTAIYMLPIGLAAWLIFSKQLSFRAFARDTFLWGTGAALIFLPFLAAIYVSGAFPAFWYDIWTAHHKIAPWFAHHTLAFRLSEWQSIVMLAPVLWVFGACSIFLFAMSEWRRPLLFMWIWLLFEVCGNVIFFTHLWRHYLLGVMLPFAILAGLFAANGAQIVVKWVQFQDQNSVKPATIMCLIIALLMIPFWGRNDWFYPGITIEQERNLAQYVSRACKEPYVLNLTNPALYIWADKQIPPVYEGERITRISYFMTLAGRGYCTREDIERTVELWKTLPVNCVVSYDRYIPQMEENPALHPLRDWLFSEFEARRVSVSQSYYGNFLLFEKK